MIRHLSPALPNTRLRVYNKIGPDGLGFIQRSMSAFFFLLLLYSIDCRCMVLKQVHDFSA